MRTSVKGAVRDALREEKRAAKGTPHASSVDSFVNLAQKLGMGADNSLSSSTYGFNPITRQRMLLEWIHRGSWLGGAAIDVIPEDMTKRGVEFTCELAPADAQKIEKRINALAVWERTAETLKWGRLYGGAVSVILIDGQDHRTPLKLESVGPDQFKGVLPLDRWMLAPSLEDLVTELGPHLGQPKYYRVQDNAPALRGQAIHHSRIAVRHDGVRLPYNQRLTENLWGISILERLYDRMVAFDSATMGAAQLVYKSYLRTLKVDGFRELVATGGKPLEGFMSYVNMMRRYQGQEGITVIDGEDEFDIQQTSAFSSVGDIILQIGQQLSGALQIPLVRLFGQSPAGLNSTGESDMRNYYDGIHQRQETDLREGITTIYRLCAQSEGVKIPEDFGIEFRSLWELDEEEKAQAAKNNTDAVTAAVDGGIIGRQTALKELRSQSRRTGIFTHITQETIDSADDEVAPPPSEQLLQGAGFGDDPHFELPGVTNAKTGQDGEAGPVAARSRRRVEV